MKRANSIRLWLLRHLSWLSLLPATAVSLALGVILLATIDEDLEEENRAFGDAIVAEVTQLVQKPASELARLLARLGRDSEPGEVERTLQAAVLANQGFEAIYLAGPDDRIVAGVLATPGGPDSRPAELHGLDVSGWDYIAEARESGTTVWSDTHLSALGGQITVAVAVPDGAQVLVGEISLRRLSEFARRIGASGHLATAVVDRRGQVVAHPDPAASLQQVNLSHLEVVRDGRLGRHSQHPFEISGRLYTGTASRIPGPDWLAIVGQPYHHSQNQIDRAKVVMILALLGGGLLSWGLAVRLARRLGEPLEALVSHAETISGGHYDASPPATPWPELDRLRDAMSTMVRSIVHRERALLATEHRYRALVDGMDDLIVQFDVRLRVQYSNPAAEVFLDLLPADCLGMPLLEMFHADDRERSREAIERWLDSEQWQLSLENRVVAHEGPSKRVLWSMSKEFGEQGELTGCRGIARDITEVRRGQEALRGLVAATARQSGEEFFRSLVLHIARTLDIEHAIVARRGAEDATMHTLAVWSGHTFRDNFGYRIEGTPCERLLHSDRGVLAEPLSEHCCPGPLCLDRQLHSFLGATLRDSHGNGVGTLLVLSERDLSAQPEYIQLISIFADRAAMELGRQQLEAELRLAASVFESSAEGIMITDTAHRIVSANAACEPITGYAPAELVGHTPHMLRSGRHEAEFYDQLAEAVGREGQWTGEVWNRRKDGHVYPQWMTVTAVKDAAGRPVNFISSFFDISARKEAEARIHFLAHHDALTGLPNRVLMQDRLGQALSTARRKPQRLAVMFMDLDRFKLINDSLGHDFGDALLEQVAARLGKSLREGETVARLGGDEFVIIVPGLQQSEDASQVAARILDAIGTPMQIRGQSFHVTASIGISIYPEDGDNGDMLLRNADTAMYHAKELGRDNFQFYTESLNAIVTERVQLESDMRRGLDKGEFVVHYQPQVDARNGRVVGAEALVRWRHPSQGMVAPDRFIPVAEDSGLIVPLGEFVMREACRQAAAWQRGGEVLRIGVNISARQFSASNLLDTVRIALDDSGLGAELLELEITESMLMERPDEAARLLERLSDLGVRLAIDDFGTGYSSLSYLRRFAIDRLKVDQSFIQDLSHDPNDAAIVRAVISLAHTLNLEVIAEGVETTEHLAQLREWGCFDVQGYLFSRPLPPDEFERFRALSAGAAS